jgi:hypothetical protein
MCQCLTDRFILTAMEFECVLMYFVGTNSGAAILILAQDLNVTEEYLSHFTS